MSPEQAENLDQIDEEDPSMFQEQPDMRMQSFAEELAPSKRIKLQKEAEIARQEEL